MKTIYELWDEIEKHPDYVTGSLWTVEGIALEFREQVEEYIEFYLELEEIEDEEIEKYSVDIVKQNIHIFKYYIIFCPKDWNLEISIYDLVLPKFEVSGIG